METWLTSSSLSSYPFSPTLSFKQSLQESFKLFKTESSWFLTKFSHPYSPIFYILHWLRQWFHYLFCTDTFVIQEALPFCPWFKEWMAISIITVIPMILSVNSVPSALTLVINSLISSFFVIYILSLSSWIESWGNCIWLIFVTTSSKVLGIQSLLSLINFRNTNRSKRNVSCNSIQLWCKMIHEESKHEMMIMSLQTKLQNFV